MRDISLKICCSPETYLAYRSGGGYCSEAQSYLIGLQSAGVSISAQQHGDGVSQQYLASLSQASRRFLQSLLSQPPVHDSMPTICVCHSEPGAWHPALYSTSMCPLPGCTASIGRTMFESDRLPDGWALRLQGMTEVWVPTAFHRSIFLRDSKLPPSRVRVVPEAVDTRVFAPRAGDDLGEQPWIPAPHHTRFISVFKWEHRKGWDVLLSAWWGAFSSADAARLYIRTAAYHSRSDFAAAVREYLFDRHGCNSPNWDAHRSVRGGSGEAWCVRESGTPPSTAPPPVLVQPEERELPQIWFVPPMSEADMPRLYRSMHCLVLPSRGEGWGRPHSEAMATGLPVIATHWSGPTEFMYTNNSLPLHISGLKAAATGAFAGHMFAEPDVAHLMQLLQWVHQYPKEAAALGRQARQDMVQRFSIPAVTEAVLDALRQLLMTLPVPQRSEL